MTWIFLFSFNRRTFYYICLLRVAYEHPIFFCSFFFCRLFLEDVCDVEWRIEGCRWNSRVDLAKFIWYESIIRYLCRIRLRRTKVEFILFSKCRSCETNFTLEKCLCWYLLIKFATMIGEGEEEEEEKKSRNEKKIYLFTPFVVSILGNWIYFQGSGIKRGSRKEKQTISDKFWECWWFYWISIFHRCHIVIFEDLSEI